jgi:hypothetical protein
VLRTFLKRVNLKMCSSLIWIGIHAHFIRTLFKINAGVDDSFSLVFKNRLFENYDSLGFYGV